MWCEGDVCRDVGMVEEGRGVFYAISGVGK